MKLSYRWLKEFTEIDRSPEDIVKALTMSGLEVEGYTEINPVFTGVRIGKVLSCEKHKNADRLSVCEVESGDAVFTVVCGAPNVRSGLWVPFAPPGATLPGITIKKAIIRGVESAGMICSEKELGFSDESSGIMELSGSLTSGADFAESMKIQDVVFHVEITPNRGDCCSVLGVAREIAAIFKVPLHQKEPGLAEDELPDTDCSIQLDDSEGCPLYAARVISGVKIGPSPFWLQRRLESVGVRSINNVVDATNYVMMERGQPLHAFDYDLLENNTIRVRRAGEKEQLVCIDDVTRELDTSVLVIADAEKPVAVAGVMGGKHTEVSENTVNILLESAFFNPASVRHSSKETGLSTEASYRFERRVDPSGVIRALNTVSAMILSIAGGECSVLKKSCAGAFEPVRVPLRLERINAVLGTDLKQDDISGILESLQFAFERNKTQWNVSIPLCRGDLAREIDLIEEIARIHGYNNIPAEVPPLKMAAERSVFSPGKKKRDKARHILFSLGLSEVITYSFIAPDMIGFNDSLPESRENIVEILNPVSEDWSVMRPSLLPGLLQVAMRNTANGNDPVCCYEMGNVFKGVNTDALPEEKALLSIIMTGKLWGSGWHEGRKCFDFFSLKGLLSEFFLQMNIAAWSAGPLEDSLFHPGRSAAIHVNGSIVGRFGEIHPETVNAMRIHQPLLAAEIDFEKLVSFTAPEPFFSEISRFPSVERDIAVIVDKSIPHETLIHAINNAGADNLDRIDLFDIYTGDPIPKNKKSMAYSLLFKSNSGTLTDVEVESAVDQIRESLKQSVKCEFR